MTDKLKDVKATKWDNCFTFALKLVGIFTASTGDEEDFIELHKNQIRPADFDKMPDGALIVWDLADPVTVASTFELIRGVPLTTKKTYYQYHFGVYFKGLVYDLSYTKDETPYIRVRDPKNVKTANFIQHPYFY